MIRATNVPTDLVAVSSQGAEVAADWQCLKSAENYFGYERTVKFASTEGPVHGQAAYLRLAGSIAIKPLGVGR